MGMTEGIAIISQTEMTEPSITAYLITVAVFGIISIALMIFKTRVELEPFEVAVLIMLLGFLSADVVSDLFAAPTGGHEYIVFAEESTTVGDIMGALGLGEQDHFLLGIEHKNTDRGNEND